MIALPETRQELSMRAAVLAEALPYLRAFRGATLVVKYGGAAMTDAAMADAWARDVVLLEHVGLRPVVVHGGGPALTRALEQMGLPSRFEDGLRVTTAETAEVAEMVLSGRINKEVVARLGRAGARAVGLSGTDAGLLRVRRHRPGGRDLGFVGEIESVDAASIRLLIDHGYLPVVSSTAADAEGRPHNINADEVAGALAVALSATKLVFLSDVPGVTQDGATIPVLTAARARALLEDGGASGGMRPKLRAALAALDAGVGRVHLVDGRLPHALLLEIFTDRGAGTLMVRDHEEEAA